MLDIAAELHRWVEQGRDFAVATVVSVSGSAPRRSGASLAVDSRGAVIGSVSGGCVEGAVYELCVQALAEGEVVLQCFGYGDDDAFAVGLTCGGTIDVHVAPVRMGDAARPVLATALAAASQREAVAVARVASGPAELLDRALVVRPDGSPAGGFGAHPDLDLTTAVEAGSFLAMGRTGTWNVGADSSRCGEPLTVLIESSTPPPRLIVFGAIDFAAALVRVGKFLGYHVTVCDARPVFTTEDRFPDADEIVVEWPQEYLARTTVDARTALCVLTHDAKFDVPLLELALRLPVAYVGAMGSRRTHAERATCLREAGVTAAELARLRSPIGLDLGARTPEETAVSIVAEMVAAREGGTGTSLTDVPTPIHRDGASRRTSATA
ncbi:putative xanthine dehydrogenase subunit A [Streptomyces sp. YIM 130001]|uniref:XdhC family protein n=1 Tax=Streptomyces sp. YIM 130001 TaxID=2259644 RepID=UPI000E6502E4|nr:XdhC/CoxI family protein [Streptomyces sp. YIM 130001]RII20453.1 putative xanthine dehydrogenase subunit A [Streptomyces sp. YIM 130001]